MCKRNLFIVSILCFAIIVSVLTGCDINHDDNGSNSETTQGEVTTSSNEEPSESGSLNQSESETETEQISIDQDDEVIDDPNILREELIAVLTEYLNDFRREHFVLIFSLSEKIDQIKDGTQTLLVSFDNSDENRYYACAYYSGQHEYEASYYCCTSEYTWIRYNSEKDIKEYVDDKKCVAAFQIDKSVLCEDILNESQYVKRMEHYLHFYPEFENNINVSAPTTREETFIYLNTSQGRVAYHSVKKYDNPNFVIKCFDLDGHIYVYSGILSEDINNPESDLTERMWGKYKDDLMKIVITDKAYVTDKSGEDIYSGVFDLTDFAHFLKSIKD